MRFVGSLKLFPLFLFLPFVSGARAEADSPHYFCDGGKVLLLGDSITRDGRYWAAIDAYLLTYCPTLKAEVFNLGLGSETASGLSEPDHPFPRPCILSRVDACLSFVRPDVTFICYGMNDGIYYPFSEARFAAYRQGMLSLVERVAATGSRVVVVTAPPFDAGSKKKGLQAAGQEEYSYKKPYRDYNSSVLARYAAWVVTLSTHDGVEQVIDIHTPLTDWIEKRRKADPKFTDGDGVHPATPGHFQIARVILEGLGVSRDAAAGWVSFLGEAGGKFYKNHLKVFRMRSSAYREFIGYPQLKNKERVGDRALMEERLRAAAQVEKTLAPE